MPAGGVSQNGLGAVPDCAEDGQCARRRPIVRSRENCAGRERGEAACRNFRDEVTSKRVTSKPRPAHLPLPYLCDCTVAERLREWPINHARAQIILSNELGGRGVFCSFERERANAAGSLEQGPAKQHRLALRKAHSEAVGKTLPARLVRVEERAFELGPDIAGSASDRGR